MRNRNGRFTYGNKAAFGHGRPHGSGKAHLKDLCWESIRKVAYLIFKLPEVEMKAWLEKNKDSLSRAELTLIEASENNLGVIESLLDRIVGKTLKVGNERTERDPIIERLYSMNREGLKREIDDLIEARRIIQEEENPTKSKAALYGV